MLMGPSSREPTPLSPKENFAVKVLKLNKILLQLENHRTTTDSTKFNVSGQIAPLVRHLRGTISSQWSTAKIHYETKMPELVIVPEEKDQSSHK